MFKIRVGEREDCIAIEALIKELAAYEKMPNGPKIDHKVLAEDGFGDQRLFWTFVAELQETKEIIGYSLFFWKYSTWNGRCLWMEDLYVKPEYRGHGIGRQLFIEVMRFAERHSCHRVEWNCLDWNQNSISFYKKFGAIDLTEKEGWHTFRLERQQINKLSKESDNSL